VAFMNLTGAEVVADFVSKHLFPKVFLVTGGACAFMVDAIGEHPNLGYICFQHEQAAAMAADAIWRTNAQIGVTMATSGPGATNLITGIACSWFDSIPSFHITGQVNDSESAAFLGAKVRQAGFQETDIVGMVTPITKFAKRVTSIEDLCRSLVEGFRIATTGRMGPVLIDIPMNIQKAKISQDEWFDFKKSLETNRMDKKPTGSFELSSRFEKSKRPILLLGGGLVSSGTISVVQRWCEKNSVPFVSTWSAMPHLDRSSDLYYGSIGVYGSRAANWAVQACDLFISLGSRLDNRQRTAHPKGFAPFSKKIVFDIDKEELKKFDSSYECIEYDLARVEEILPAKVLSAELAEWSSLLANVRGEISEGMEVAARDFELNPYEAVRTVQNLLQNNAIVISDCGANLCWVYQAFLPSKQLLFTAAGNSPMGYSLPAAIGASVSNPERQIACFIGDGGFQMNIQELQTIVNLNLPIKIFIQNNAGYGIIKQFQDSYFEGRHHASGEGYSIPSFSAIAKAYGISYFAASSILELERMNLDDSNPQIIDIILPEDALITPKVEMDRFIHDQFPYTANPSIATLPFAYPQRPSQL
jgi:acetolactate synthase-1/2/3 large subunit